MPRSLFIPTLCLGLVTIALPVRADQYDDCMADCRQTVAPCVEQARLSAGNIQEEEDSIAACEKNKAVCIKGCKDAETVRDIPPPPKEEPPQPRTPVDFEKGIQMYEFK